MPKISAIVAVDGDNLSYALAELPNRFDPQRITAILCEISGVAQKDAALCYFSTAGIDRSTRSMRGHGWINSMRVNGWTVITVPPSIRQVKGGEYRRSGMPDSHIQRHINHLLAAPTSTGVKTIVLYTGDRAFQDLLSRAKQRGIYTVVVSTRHALSRTLREVANRVVLLDTYAPQ
ncbi:hypothetical protein A3B21_03700 [Candidatus Uhrbacteria bacterium RIFCSPLOWO2_01_FULL_47_24]|uniref:NYN domain-containing protein n=1 Tax=Candidatus Uhrbacteria bacterium RIFCSPLOWO2_01_FULL_47_24 TaxID=1802401 RepID=A0A1F7URI2_9BACT|nr:MAG: hypothetical protein A3B21_03700 [Candidatus Uhrbacteria bacterium RIFCSPLOWO2_01_FULL_47_24]